MDFQKILSQSDKKPQNILKIVLSFSVTILVIWLFMVSRMDLNTSNQSQDPKVQARTEGLKTSLLQNEQQIESPNEKATDVPNETALREKEAPDVFQNAFVTFVFMITVMGGIWFWVKKKGTPSPKNKQGVRDLGDHMLGQGSQLKFVEINQEVWVLGLSAGSVNLLHRIPKAEWNEKNAISESNPDVANTTDFKSLYKYFRN